MLNDIGKVDNVHRPDVVKGSRERGNKGSNKGSNKDHSPTANSQDTKKEESQEEENSSHLLDIRI
jgi:hypothetical protein